jgi:hypothetical protein
MRDFRGGTVFALHGFCMRNLRDWGRPYLQGITLAITGWLLMATSEEAGPARDCYAGLGNAVLLHVRVGGLDTSTGTGSPDSSDGSAVGYADGSTGGTGTSASAGAWNGVGASAMAGTASVGWSGADAGPALATGDSSSPTTRYPSCQGMDALGEGTELVLDLAHGSRPYNNGACWGYAIRGMTGLTGVTVDPASSRNDGRFTTPTGDAAVLAGTSGELTFPDAPNCRGTWKMTLRIDPIRQSGQTVSPLDAGGGRWLLERSITLAQAQFCAAFSQARGELTCVDQWTITEMLNEAP